MNEDLNVSADLQAPGVPANPAPAVETTPSVEVSVKPTPSPRTIKQGEIQMADVDSTVLAEGQAAIRHDVALAASNVRGDIGASTQLLEKGIGDNRYSIATEAASLSRQIGAESCGINQEIGTARREAAAGFADTRYNIATNAGDIRRDLEAGFCATNKTVLQEGQDNVIATKDARHDVLTKVDQTGDRLSDKVGSTTDQIRDKLWSLNRDIIDTKTQVQTGFVGVTKDVEIGTLKTQLDAAKNTQFLSDKIEADGDRTRALINDLKYHDLNRGLVERNAELVECEADRRYWRHHAEQNQFQGQWAQLQSQIQAFASQLQETRQGLVNFGTMAGNAGQQSSTSNNVR